MANCHKQFLEFDGALNISPTMRKRLGAANKTVRQHIRKLCAEKGYPLRRIKVQGSKQFGTLIRKRGEESDIDIGVYFYPKPDIKPQSLMKAIHTIFANGHRSQTQPEHKKKCVRIPYASGFHIDLPIYYLKGLRGKGKSYLATTRNGWIKSDPREFEDWFQEKKGIDKAQLVRIVRYLKAWCHHIAGDRRVPQGVALTTMAGMFYVSMPRDDEALLHILKGVSKKLSRKWSCKMPIVPKDELLDKFSKADREYFLQQIKLFISDAQNALETRSIKHACTIWRTHLGRHFEYFR